jgi:hypothetical protein
MDSLISKKIKAGKSTPSPRMASSLVYFEGSLYLFGYAPLKEVPNSDLFRFDLESYEWEKVETLGTPPEPRIQHYAVIFNREMFVLYGMLFEALQEYDSIYKFNFDSRTWIFLSQEIDTRVTVAGSVLVGSKFYLFYGRTTQDVMNSVFSIDLSKNPPEREIVSPDFITPEARIYHCSVVISSFMYTFGGTDANSDDTETFFNDLWQFDFGTLKWNFVNTLGYTPSKRKSFGCTKSLGDVFAIFGGIGPNGLLEDFYYFHETFKTWYQVQPDGLSPSPRRGSCLTYHNYTYFVIGGKNTEKGFNEIWIYSVETNKFVLMEEMIFKDGNDIHDAHCWVEDHGSKVEIVVVGGNNFLNIPNPYTVRINVFYQNSTVLVNQSYLNHTDQSPSVVAAGSVLVKGGESLFIVGGVLFDYVMISPIRLKNLKTNEYILYDLPENLNIYGATGVHYQKSFYIFSGGGASDTFRSTYQLTSNIFKISFNSSDDLKLGCSEGHYSEKCKQCSQGTYFDNGICLPCPKGRYSKTLAATSIEQCQPCPAGTFSNKEGSFQCLDCPSGRTCPIGSSEPKLNFELPQNRSAQPNAYENKKSFISYIVANLWFSMSGVAIFLITLCLVFISIWDKIQKFDIFVSQHSNDLGVPVIHRKTKTGGLFSIFFVMASIITIVAGFLNYQLDNVSEIKALIPVISLDSKISAQQTIITSIFYIYGGECIDKDGKCNSNIFYQDSGISYSHRFISCSTFEENCQIKAKYSNLELTLKTAEIQIKLKEKSSYSTAISVNITSSSSIPDQLSGTFTSFTTGSDEALFRGTTASKVFFKLTPSVFFIQLFISESSEWPSEETGFQVSSHQDPERGSLATRST